MNKNELKQARKELVNIMKKMRILQKIRKINILENKKPKENYNFEIDKLIIKTMSNNINLYHEIFTNDQATDEFIRDITKEVKQKK